MHFGIAERGLYVSMSFKQLIKMNYLAAGERAGHSFATSGLPPSFGRKDIGRIF